MIAVNRTADNGSRITLDVENLLSGTGLCHNLVFGNHEAVAGG